MRGVEMLVTSQGMIRIGGGEQSAAGQRLPAGRLAGLLGKVGLSPDSEAAAVTVYVAEELLFCKSFTLPAKTPAVKEAIRYQLDQLLPFPEEAYFYSYSAEREEKGTRVTLYAVPREVIEVHLRELSDGGQTIAGLFPLSQRYLGRGRRKEQWSLLLPGAIAKMYTFRKGRLRERLLCPSPPTFAEAVALGGSDVVYCPNPAPESGFADADVLLVEAPLGKDFNLLPLGYRRPDYFKIFVSALALLNVLALFLLLGLKEYRFHQTSARVDAEIMKLQPEIKKISALNSQENELEKGISRFEELGGNPDLIAMFSHLTAKLPASAYLDQIRMEKRDGPIIIDGYADDMTDLSQRLQGFGEVRLRSTSRRNNKNYFQLELTLP
ncbi:hypothetical protein ACUUL3_15065 [Thiovibrio sp. JS02]